MIRALATAGLLVALAGGPIDASACRFDSDCAAGSRCEKAGGSVAGTCVGGTTPGKESDRRPERDPADTTGRKGETCRTDADCGRGGRCAPGSGGIHGTCL